jgi:adenine nucleotide transporter 17
MGCFLSFDDDLQSTYGAVVDVLKREGFFGLYSGLNSSLLGIAITNGCVTALT